MNSPPDENPKPRFAIHRRTNPKQSCANRSSSCPMAPYSLIHGSAMRPFGSNWGQRPLGARSRPIRSRLSTSAAAASSTSYMERVQVRLRHALIGRVMVCRHMVKPSAWHPRSLSHGWHQRGLSDGPKPGPKTALSPPLWLVALRALMVPGRLPAPPGLSHSKPAHPNLHCPPPPSPHRASMVPGRPHAPPGSCQLLGIPWHRAWPGTWTR